MRLLGAILSSLLLLALTARADGAPARGEAGRPAKPRVVFIGWDGADWQLLDELSGAGKMPTLSSLAAKGRTWNLVSYEPMASPLIWTTMATGRTPVDHGVTDFQELDPRTRQRLPISGRSRRVPAIWNLASARGISVGVVNWWATWPAEKVQGFLVSDRAAPVLFDPEALSKSPALCWPEGLADGVRIVVGREASPPYEDVARGLAISRAEFDAAVAEKEDLASPVTAYRKILGVTRAASKIALDLYDREGPELLMLYIEGTDEIGHVLARFSPPRLPGVSDEDFRKYSGGVAAYYEECDRLLGEFARRAGRDGATLILASDHGFKWGAKRPSSRSGIQFDTAYSWHEQPGILLSAGPAVVPSGTRGRASVFDITPTLCRLLGLPADPAFEGQVIAGFGGARVPPAVPKVAWRTAAPVERLVVHEVSPGERKAADEFTKKLVSLGYLTGAEASAVDARPADRAGTQTAASFQNVATFLRARGRPGDALPWYRRALEVDPKSSTAWMNLSIALQMLDRWDESDQALLTALASGYGDPEAAVTRRVGSYEQRARKAPQARRQLVSFLRKVTEAFPGDDRYRAFLGKALFESHDCSSAEALFEDVVQRAPGDFENLNLLGLANWCLGNLDAARSAFERSLALNPNQPAIREGLGQLRRDGALPR